MPLPNIVTSGLATFYHPARIDRRSPITQQASPFLVWQNLLGMQTFTSNTDLVPFASGNGSLTNPYAIRFQGTEVTLSGYSPGFTATIWFRLTPEEHDGRTLGLFYLGNYAVGVNISIDSGGYLKSGGVVGTRQVNDGNLHCVAFRGWYFGVGNYDSGGFAGDTFLDGQIELSNVIYRQTYANTTPDCYLKTVGNFSGTIYCFYTHNRKLSDVEMQQNYNAGFMLSNIEIACNNDFVDDFLNQVIQTYRYVSLITSDYDETQRVEVTPNIIDKARYCLVNFQLIGSDFSSEFPLECIRANFYKDTTSTSPVLSVPFSKITFYSGQDIHNLFLTLRVV